MSEDAPRVNRAAVVAGVARDLDAHLRSLRRKLERAALRGEPVERLQARIRREEEQLRRLRAYEQGQLDTRRPE
ncbi:MAG TPA: hypothetical protein VF240_18655 [Pyrinomonadaceae bacterium]